MRISILISAYNRAKEIKNCLNSIVSQEDDIEVVLVNDASIDNTDEVVKSFSSVLDIKYIKNDIRRERAISYGKAIEAATGDWMFHMGSDDLVYPGFVKYFFEYVKKYPETLLFNYGWAANNKHTMRMTVGYGKRFEPYKHFESGLVAAGSFCWSKKIKSQIEMPMVMNCYELADESGIPGYGRKTRTLGNPWGEDYYIFWRLTRKNISTHIPLVGIIINVR